MQRMPSTDDSRTGTRLPEDVEHRRVVAHHEGHEPADAPIASGADELAQEKRRGATSLIFVDYREGDLGRVAAGGRANVAAVGDHTLVASHRDGQYHGDVVVEIDFGQAPEILARELGYGMKEAVIDAAWRQPRECDLQPLLVVGADRAHADRRTVAQHGSGRQAR